MFRSNVRPQLVGLDPDGERLGGAIDRRRRVLGEGRRRGGLDLFRRQRDATARRLLQPGVSPAASGDCRSTSAQRGAVHRRSCRRNTVDRHDIGCLSVARHAGAGAIGFAVGLIVAVAYFLFVIIADTLRGNPKVHPELLIWIPNVLFIVLGAFLFRRLARQ